MRDFLKRFGATTNPKLKELPKSRFQAEQERDRLFRELKGNLAQGIPVIVHQYWSKVGSNGHYRLVIGFDDSKQEIYLNDATKGRQIVQNYERFLVLWNVDEPWLHYNAIVFNTGKDRLFIHMNKYQKPS